MAAASAASAASAVPSLPRAPQPSPSSSSSTSHMFAFVCCPPPAPPGARPPADRVVPPGEHDAWLAACYRLSPRLERLDATHALLDLGACTPAEARAAADGLLLHLDTLHPARTPHPHPPGPHGSLSAPQIGLGPSPLLAQLALLAAIAPDAAPAGRIAAITADAAPAVLRRLPVRLLPRLHPRGAITAETVMHLERYGLRTIGQIARLSEPTLRRQFGDRLGAILRALAAGQEIRPLVPTPQPQTRRFRLPFAPAATPERALAALPALARWIAQHLAAERLQAGALRLLLVWESGAALSAQTRPRAPIDEAAPLARQLQQLTLTLAQDEGTRGAPDDLRDDMAPAAAPLGEAPRIARLVVELAELRPCTAAQGAFWETTARKHAVLADLAHTLARRYPHAPLLRAVCVRPHAIFRAERYELRLLTDVSAGANADADAGRTGRADASTHHAEPEVDPRDPWDDVPQRLHWW